MSDVFKKYSIQFTYLCSNTAAIEQERGGGEVGGGGGAGEREALLQLPPS